MWLVWCSQTRDEHGQTWGRDEPSWQHPGNILGETEERGRCGVSAGQSSPSRSQFAGRLSAGSGQLLHGVHRRVVRNKGVGVLLSRSGSLLRPSAKGAEAPRQEGGWERAKACQSGLAARTWPWDATTDVPQPSSMLPRPRSGMGKSLRHNLNPPPWAGSIKTLLYL